MVLGRDATLTCKVENLQNYKVGSFNFILNFNLLEQEARYYYMKKNGKVPVVYERGTNFHIPKSAFTLRQRNAEIRAKASRATELIFICV